MNVTHDQLQTLYSLLYQQQLEIRDLSQQLFSLKAEVNAQQRQSCTQNTHMPSHVLEQRAEE